MVEARGSHLLLVDIAAPSILLASCIDNFKITPP